MFEYDYPMMKAAGAISSGMMDRQRIKLLQLQQEKEQLALDEAKTRSEGLRSAREAFANVPSRTVTQDVAGSNMGPGAPVANPDYDPSKRTSLYSGLVNADTRRGADLSGMRQELANVQDQPQYIEGQPPQMVQQQVQQEPTMQERSAAAAQELMKAGMPQEALHQFQAGQTFADTLRNEAAKAKEYGNLDKAAEFTQHIDKLTKVEAVMAAMLKMDRSGKLVKDYMAAHPDIFEGVNPDSIGINQNGVVTWKVGNNIMYYDTDGSIKHMPDNQKGFDQVDLGDKVKIVPRDGSAPYTEKKGITPNAAARINFTVDTKGKLNDSAIDLAAQQYLIDGKMPALGNGSAAAKIAIMNKAAKLAQEQGLDASALKAKAADAVAQAGGLKKMVAQYSAAKSFESTASKNFDLVERLYDQNPQTTVMLLNKLKNNINTKITGDTATVTAGRALQTALMEYAKVVTGATGGAAVSDSARREVESLLSLSDKPETFHASIANHRLEMKNRMTSFEETIADLRSGAGGKTPGANPYPQITAYIKSNLGKHSEAELIKAIRASNPTITSQEIYQAYQAAKGGK